MNEADWRWFAGAAIFAILLVMLYAVFREQIPEHRESRFGWFVTGAAGFVCFVAIAVL